MLYILLLFMLVSFIYLTLQLSKKLKNTEKQLLQQKETIKTLYNLDNSNFIMVIKLDSSSHVTYVSQSLADSLGYEPKELLNYPISSLSNEEEVFIEAQNIKNLQEEGISNFTMDKRLINKNGEFLWFSCSYTKEIDSETNSTNIVIFLIDIDWRKNVEISLKQSYELNELLLNSLNTPIAAFDENADVIAVNRAMEDFCIANNVGSSYSSYDYNPLPLPSPLSKKLLLEDQEKSNKIKDVFNGNLNSYSFEYCYKNGLDTIWYLLNVSSFEKHSGGVISYTDVSKLKELQQKLSKSEEHYRNLIELLPLSVFLHNNVGITYCNKAALNLLGIDSTSDILGKSILDYVDHDYKLYFIENLSYSSKNFISGIELILNNEKGEKIYVEIEKTKIFYDNQFMTIYIIKDIRERINVRNFKKVVEKQNKQLQEAFEYDKIKTEFLANISHELRTPINIIFSALQVMQFKNNCETTSNYMNMIKQNCYRLLRLVNNLIDITKIDSGFYNIELKNYDIINIIENITLSVANYIETRDISLIFDTEIEELELACDPDKIERIMLNLLSNAVKFTPKGGKITVNIYKLPNEIQVSVKDTGEGIPFDKLKLIFERFRQVDKSFKRNHEGSGIGLSLVKLLVELHGGTIDVNSRLGFGSEFIISLPIKLVTEQKKSIDDFSFKEENVEKINLEFSDIYS